MLSKVLGSFPATEQNLMHELLGLLLNLSSQNNAPKEGTARKGLQALIDGLKDQVCEFVLKSFIDDISYQLCPIIEINNSSRRMHSATYIDSVKLFNQERKDNNFCTVRFY